MKSSSCRSNLFDLRGQVAATFVAGPVSDTLWLDYEGRTPEKAVSKNALVYPGMVLARHGDIRKGDLHCPVVGTVADAGSQGVMIKVGAPAPKPEPVEIPETAPVALHSLHGEDLVRALKGLGIDTGVLTAHCQTLIINGLNPEPGILWAEPMLTVHADVIRAGVSLLQRVSPATNYVLALAEGFAPSLSGLDVKFVPSVYPASLNPLVVHAVTGQENPDGVTCVGLHELWKLGRVAQTGLPVTDTVLTMQGVNYIVPLGTPARVLLETAGLTASDGDTLIFGGPLRGVAQGRLQAGVSASTYGLFLLTAADVPPLRGDAACIACGECVAVCPSRIQPGLLSRYSEFGLDDKCASFHINACIDCGLCSYVCIARRPVLQHLRLALGRLAAAD